MSITIKEALNSATLPLIEARILLQLALNHASRTYLIVHADEKLTLPQQQSFFAFVQRRLKGEPIAYITQEKEFWGRLFICKPGVLIPRSDTETLVETALHHLDPKKEAWVADLGCGSGILGITIASERPLTRVLMVDSSLQALKIAQENIQKHNVEDRVCLLQSNWLAAVSCKPQFDMIISNPPYISANDPHLQEGDLRFEPIQALVAKHEGQEDLQHLINTSEAYLKSDGWLWLEHGYNQSQACYSYFNRSYWKKPQHKHDLAGWIRVTGAQKI
ncbi:MAG: peptide chain release factor N(5)-glutamine methyltransferase [Pseudomonadota bacterium]